MKKVITTLSTSVLRGGVQEEINLFSQNQNMKIEVVPYDVAIGILAIFSIVVSAISYEISFSSKRTYSNCEAEKSLACPYVNLVITLLCYLALALKYRVEKSPDAFWYLFEGILLIAFEYPSLEGNFSIPQVSRLSSLSGKSVIHNICYKVQELFYLFSLIRIYFPIKILLTYLTYKRNVREGNSLPSRNSLIKVFFFTFSMINIGISMVLSEFLRVSERPYSDITLLNFNSYLNALWCLATSLTSVGYGDFFPSTYLGRTVCFLSAAVGSIIFGVIIYAFTSFILISPNEEKVRSEIYKTRFNGEIVKAAIVWNFYIRKFGKFHTKSKEKGKVLIRKIEEKNKRKYEIRTEAENGKRGNKHLYARLNRIQGKIDKVGLRVN